MFITLKGHKDNFYNKPSCHLINPTKNEQGKISKKIIEQVNQQILKNTDVNQWKNISNVSTGSVTFKIKKIDLSSNSI